MLPLLRYTLDLFANAQPNGPTLDTTPKPTKRNRTIKPPETSNSTQAGQPHPNQVSESGSPALDVNQPQALQVSALRHPQANRDICLAGSYVAYAFTRAKRRSIGFSVGLDGLSVRAPSWVTRGAVDAALQAKSDWILRKLHDSGQRLHKQQSRHLAWCDGVSFPYLGQRLTVVLAPDLPHSTQQLCQQATGPVLSMALPKAVMADDLREAVQAWLMQQASSLFEARLNHFAPELGVQWKRLVLSNARTRWGSANSDGVIRLNWRLLHFPMAVLDYVVVHELSHLRVMNHSPAFWATVASVLPDYRSHRHALKDDAAPHWH